MERAVQSHNQLARTLKEALGIATGVAGPAVAQSRVAHEQTGPLLNLCHRGAPVRAFERQELEGISSIE